MFYKLSNTYLYAVALSGFPAKAMILFIDCLEGLNFTLGSAL